MFYVLAFLMLEPAALIFAMLMLEPAALMLEPAALMLEPAALMLAPERPLGVWPPSASSCRSFWKGNSNTGSTSVITSVIYI